MDVQVQRSFTIPPPATKSEEVPLTVFSLFMSSYYYTILFAFTSPNPTNAALLLALTATLPHFPLLTARLTNKPPPRRPCFVTGDQGSGALVVEAAVPASPLSDHLPLVPSPELVLLHPPVVDEQGAAATPHLFGVQITRFSCGGVVVATSVQHQAADGCSLSTFLHAWAGAVRAGGAVPRRLGHPVPYGPGALAPRCPPRCEFEHRGAEFLPLSSPQPQNRGGDDDDAPPPKTETTTTNMLLHYTGEFVAELRASVQDRHTAFEAVSAHLWRKVTAARVCAAAGDGDGDDADTARTTSMVKVAVDGRRWLARREAVFGNLALTALSRTDVGKLVANGGLADAAALVRAGVRAVDGRYFQSFIDFGALHGDEELVPIWEKPSAETNSCFLDLEVDSWLQLGFDSLDFGLGGRLVGILPARIPLDGVVVLIPSMREAGGIDVLVALHEMPARVLKDIAYTID
ncbi:hypothetical protein HU200_038101 [Digitaria exilis]|uniref:Uncharacterized protein n=1 Tax=Digitaria exilis TaxID=1010633 RepID=A0A835BCZ9_9POAL|nr:hypothetical protein HU200_038101 [Digitaria exilis]